MEKWENAIKELVKIEKSNHICFPFAITNEELEIYVNKIIRENKINTEYDYSYYGNMILKKAMGSLDSHSRIMPYTNTMFSLPLKLKIIDDKLYIINTDQKRNDLKYSEIIAINGVDVKILRKEIEAITSYSTKEWLNREIEKYLSHSEEIKSLPSIKKNCEKIVFTTKNNNTIKTTSFNADENNPIQSENKKRYEYELLDNNTMIINYRFCKEYTDYTMKEFITDVEKVAKDNHIEKYVIDLRGNPGGDSNTTIPLLNFISGKNSVTLINNEVFSGGVMAAYDLKKIGSIVVGENLGQSLNGFGNIKWDNMQKNFGLSYSLSFIYNNSNNEWQIARNKDALYKLPKNMFIPQIFTPDIYVENTIDDYKNGVDKQMEIALKEINKIKREVL